MRFLSYSSSKGARKLVSRALVQALRFNPGCSGLWAYAASWEFKTQVHLWCDYNLFYLSALSAMQLNPFGARALIHRGLRACTNIQGKQVAFDRCNISQVQQHFGVSTLNWN